MAGMRYMTHRCPAHLHDMRLEKKGRFADLYRCAKCDVPIYYVRDESRLSESERDFITPQHTESYVVAASEPKPYIKRKAKTDEWPDR